MKIQQGHLTDYFDGIGYKRLKPVEIDPEVSNEHEFNGISKFKEMFGLQRQTFSTRLIYLCDNEEEIIEEVTEFTWYDARENHPTRSEHRLYYKNSDCIANARPEDLMVLCKNRNDSASQTTLTVFIAKQGDTIERQLAWLFGIELADANEQGKIQHKSGRSLDYFSQVILERIGIPIENEDYALLEKMLTRFRGTFPKTVEFSAFARELISVDCRDGADVALVAWMESEERAFRILERHIVQKKIDQEFASVDEFIEFSLSVHNRRKARAGYALENHLRHAFQVMNVRHDYNKITENRTRPDFIFPSIAAYHNPKFSPLSLTMLGVKTTCKDRWRQVLPEAKRIANKHLLTLETGISTEQTKEMKDYHLQLIVPSQIFETYTPEQCKWLMNIGDFIALVKKREK